MTQMLVFGDSSTWGACDREKGGWVNRLRLFLDRECGDIFVYNLGVSGDNTQDVLGRFEFETKQRIKEDEDLIIIFDIGSNDTQFLRFKNRNRVSLRVFENNIKKLAKLAQGFTNKFVFMGFTPVNNRKTNPIPWDKNKSYKNEYIRQYNEVLRNVCSYNDINFIDIFDKFSRTNYNRLLDDGLHPNTKGHKKIFLIVKDFLTKKKMI